LNGHKASTTYPNAITASFDPTAPNYFANMINTDPYLLEDAGIFLYTHYDIHAAIAVPTGTGIFGATASFNAGTGVENLAFISTGSLARNSGSTTVPNYENFEDRFRTAFSPYVISQQFGGSPKNLFKFHALDDGEYPNDKFKISIRNIAKSTSDRDLYGSFDVIVRDFYDNDEDPVILEQFLNVNLNPSSPRYIAKIIGDHNLYFDFDKNDEGQKIVLEGNFPNLSKYIRVQVDSSVENGEVSATALPAGFRGPFHLVTSGASLLTTLNEHSGVHVSPYGTVVKTAVEPPIPFREHVTYGTEPKKKVSKNLFWGVQFERKDDVSETNRSLIFNDSITSHTRYFPNFHTVWQDPWAGANEGTADSGGTIFDADRFNRNLFSLEYIQVRTASNGLADPKEWASASFVRGGNISTNATNKTRAFSLETDLDDLTAKTFAKFTFFMQGGFNGVRIFDEKSAKLLNEAVIEEMSDANRGENEGPTVQAYMKALSIMGVKSEVDVKLLAIPGIRHSYVTNQAITTVEDRFDALYLMDIEEKDTLNTTVTSSIQQHSVNNTATAFAGRGLDTSFAAAYYPDQIMVDPTTLTNVQVPPSVVVLGAMALNDAVAHPWFAPAGFARGSLATVVESAVKLNQSNLDTLHDADINPIVSFPGTGPVIWGQKTLLAAQSALDRVNVRRLLIEIRRQVRDIAQRMVFEPNRESTLSKFEGLVRPRLQRIQELNGVDRFKVKIDTTTTTQADVENNTIRGKIYVQPTKTIEFVSLDFVVTNTGASI
jgi:phage tail sheath protein FI